MASLGTKLEIQQILSGVGVGLRAPHYSHVLDSSRTDLTPIRWFEALSENYMGLTDSFGGRGLKTLVSIRETYPVILHGVSLSIGSIDPLDKNYLARLRLLADQIEPAWISDHLCWTGVNGENIHDLLPLPYTEEALDHLETRIDTVQEYLGKPLVLENVSAYLNFKHSEMTEWEFLTALVKRTGCRLLLDVNNVYVSSINQSFTALDFLRGVPRNSIQQIHLAGHSRRTDSTGELLIDTHDGPVCDAVWELYRAAIQLWGKVPTLIEWDDQIPEFSVLQAEALKAFAIMEGSVGAKAVSTHIT